MSFDTVWALEFAGFTLLGVAIEQTRQRVWGWWRQRRGGHLAPVSATTYWASMFLLLTLISLAFSASSRIKSNQQTACLAGVIQYDFGLINDRGKLQKDVSTAQKAFYRDFYDALVHPVDPTDTKAHAAQLRLFTAALRAVVSAQNTIDNARDIRPYRTGQNCV
jgi:hypothetical protein